MSTPKETEMLNAMVKTAIEAAFKRNRLFHPSATVDAIAAAQGKFEYREGELVTLNGRTPDDWFRDQELSNSHWFMDKSKLARIDREAYYAAMLPEERLAAHAMAQHEEAQATKGQRS
jgi:hypothetical protein